MTGIAAHLRNLGTFGGRESRGSFWPYAGCVVVFVLLVSMAAMIPVMADTFGKVAQLAAEDPGAVTTHVGPGGYSVQVEAGHPEVMPNLGGFLGVMVVEIIAAVGLLAAAVSRRLHDSGLSGYWGLLPVPFLITGAVAFPILAGDFSNPEGPDLTLFMLLFFNNVIYMVALVTLIVLLCRSGTGGPNRFGPDPK